MNSYTFVVNPKAGRGAGSKAIDRIHKLSVAAGVTYEIEVTQGVGDATEIARNAESSVVVAVGGDGTINEVVNGIIGTSKILGVIPAGSGNDFIKSAGIPQSLEVACEAVWRGTTTAVDVGRVTCSGAGIRGNSDTRLFVNGAGIGFDAAVADRTRRHRWLTGTVLYAVAVLQTLGRYKSPLFSIRMGGGRETYGRKLLIAVGNGQCAGGGFYLTPDALLDDRQLDVCMIEDISAAQILILMPKVLRGRHMYSPSVSIERTDRIEVRADGPFHAHADGEIVGENIVSIIIEMSRTTMSVIRS